MGVALNSSNYHKYNQFFLKSQTIDRKPTPLPFWGGGGGGVGNSASLPKLTILLTYYLNIYIFTYHPNN